MKTYNINIDSKIKDIKENENLNIKDFTIQQLRGHVIDGFNTIDEKIDLIITDYFKPEKVTEFKKVILNNSVVNSGAKMKILKNIETIDDSIIDRFSKINTIRNNFAHIRLSASFKIDLKVKEGGYQSTVYDYTSIFHVMNSSGKVEPKSVLILIEEFEELKSKILIQLDNVSNDKHSN